VTIKTGRTHQIRVHLAHAGPPHRRRPEVRRLRAQPELAARARSASTRMFLHARELAFDHPASGERITLHARCRPSARHC
jgi:23S rRNA pseudouridine955/2504/2580 synthase